MKKTYHGMLVIDAPVCPHCNNLCTACGAVADARFSGIVVRCVSCRKKSVVRT